MSQNLPNMLDKTIAKMREMVDANTVVGQPIEIQEGLTIIPISSVSVGFASGGTDFVPKNVNNSKENPFGGGAGGGVKVKPVAFLVVKDGSVRVMPLAAPANTTTDRIVEMLPDAIDKVVAYFDAHSKKKSDKDEKSE